MAHLAIGWELGNGMGHILPLRMLAEQLLARGHKLTFVVRDLSAAERALGDLPVTWLQCPLVPYQPWELTRTDCYSQLLGNIGFRDRDKLAATVCGWRDTLAPLKVDAALLEYAPSGMLACQSLGIPFALQGNGFFCPPAKQPDFGIMKEKMAEPARLAEDAALLASVNAVMADYDMPAYGHLADLYAAAKTTLLVTFAELDHFGRPPESAVFRGVWVPGQSAAPVWPQTPGKKIFAYLHARPGVDRLLQMLKRGGQPTLVACPGVTGEHRRPFEAPHLRFLDQLLDIRQVAREADIGVFHGNHSSTALFLLEGTPTFQVPLYMEQLMFAQRVREIGAGELATLDRPERIAQGLNLMISSPLYRQAAERFAARYQDYDQAAAIVGAADDLEAAFGFPS